MTTTVNEPATTRFWLNVVKSEVGCWQWLGTVNPKGYGRFSLEGKARNAHRVAYEWMVGPVPGGMVLDHLCRNRACVNPRHLEPVTNRENVLRGEGLSAVAAARDTCAKGHPYTADNLRINAKGHRECRTCDRQDFLDRASRWEPVPVQVGQLWASTDRRDTDAHRRDRLRVIEVEGGRCRVRDEGEPRHTRTWIRLERMRNYRLVEEPTHG